MSGVSIVSWHRKFVQSAHKESKKKEREREKEKKGELNEI